MRKIFKNSSLFLHIYPKDTYDWAHKESMAWPCSTLSGKKIVAEYYGGELVDLKVFDGKKEIDERQYNDYELKIILEDFTNKC